MLNQSASLDRMFHALADPGRRAMLDRLVSGPASVKDLAEPLTMSLPAVLQHLQVLENSGLVTSQKIGRVRTCSLQPDAMRAAEAWLSDRRGLWERRLDRLGAFLSEDDDNPTGESS
jgi:DNA-binding transcriptional ArsR family regulator